MFKRIILASFALSSLAHAQVLTQQNILQGINLADPSKVKLNEVILDRITYNDKVFSTSKKTELGDESELSMSLRYHVEPTTFTRFRFVTDPVENRYNNKTSRFEIIFAKTFKKINLQIDLDLLTNDTDDEPNSGGTSVGPDLDSDDTFIVFNMNPKNSIVFYPFNFRSDVGDEFNTLDVTRIFSIEGSPTSIGATPIGSENIVNKTVPGFEYNFHAGKHTFYAGVGSASYLYPSNSDFNIETNPVPTSWERKQTTAFKLGYLLIDSDKTKVNLQYLTHNHTDETGALLDTAASLNVFKRMNNFIVELESTMSKAGERPYNVDNTTRWFRNLTPSPFLPVYSDINGDRQDWVGKTGYGHSLKIGYNFKDVTPYLSLKYQDEYFVFDGDESAHLLRNSDETLSHGGLKRIGLGAYFYEGNLFFRPQIEYQSAENPVFTNSTDQRSDRSLSSFEKNNFILSFNLTYTFDGFSSNQLWWF